MVVFAAILTFWTSALLIVYSYALYPALVWTAARLVAKSPVPPALGDAELPRISLLIAAYNEEAVIEQRIVNALAMDYPRSKIEIAIASDGSSDQTAELVRRYADRGVRLIDYGLRQGKANVLNRTIPGLSGELVLLSDANTFTRSDAPRQLVRWFCDPAVGAVCGRLILTDPASGRNVDSLYWRYETFLKKQESRLGALLGANGAIYAFRKELFCPIPNQTIVDDFVIPLLIKQRCGAEIIYDPGAVAEEESAPDLSSEFRRRSRIGAGGWQAICILWQLLNPARGWVAFTFFSHKVLRWLCPFCMILMLIGSLVLWRFAAYRILLIAQLGGYVAAWLGGYVPTGYPLSRPLRLLNMFVGMNAALFVGFVRWLRGAQTGMWQRTRRAGESEGIVV